MTKGNIRLKHREGFGELNRYWSRLADLEKAVEDFYDFSLAFVEEPIDRVLDKIRSFEPSVSVIGQIKAGKSTLVNALVGETDLLPSDVNPWTSVITALHLNSRHRPMNTRALFRFFDQHEWDRLVATGGRLGEMAARAGFDQEADEVRAQVTQMRQSTEARLGADFAGIIGSNHSFPDLDKETINRYICYGDPSDLKDASGDGVYADITKTADLYIDAEGLPSGLCIRDTPGVNDTFMMREQITLNAIQDSRVCVVVLSAHQALSTMDVAILRIICAVEAREVVIFVNRIDELADPKAEEEKISASIRRTLARLGLNQDIPILFGSGYWANFALSGEGALMPRSLAALQQLTPDLDVTDHGALREAAFEASGVPALHRLIAERVIDGPGAAFLKDIEAEIKLIIEMSEAVDSAARLRDAGMAVLTISQEELLLKVADSQQKVMTTFDAAAVDLRAALHERLTRARDTFVESAVEALQSHIQAFGETGSWDHDPTGLRMMMRTAYLSSCARLRREGEISFESMLDAVQDVLQNELGVYRNAASIDFPEQQQHSAPTVLARTLSFDLQATWWHRIWDTGATGRLAGRFLRFGQAKKVEKKYRALIIEETQPLIDNLLADFFDPAVAATRGIVTGFALDQSRFCEALLERLHEKGPDEVNSGQMDETSLARLADTRRMSA
ncbi:dynamin family protein [Rhodobacter sp. 24-YEA-8]|uniref:dynamin family protein n=1 Tax=Rhodobacter sp. 24-YEA-8 TaxID=1884310 RepID=UPI000894245A|nr:dynamin family protein [Rhodobacter sp. 24-YEA-8]SEC74798.1 Dynamin family protein [Rhodobacter sp. 24-YEA-8]